MQVMNLSLLFFGLYFIFTRQLHLADHRRSGMALAVAWFTLIVSWWHISGTGRDYNSLVDLSCLIPYTRSLWCKAVVWIALIVDTPKPTFSIYEIPIRVSDFVIIFLLMFSYLGLYHSRGSALPNPVVAVIPVTSRLKSFCGSLFGSLGRSKYLSIPVISLAFAHITFISQQFR